MKIRHHKNNRWFKITYRTVNQVPEGHRWTGTKMVPRSTRVERSASRVEFKWGSDAFAIGKVFKRAYATCEVLTVRPATEGDCVKYNLTQPR